MGCDPECVCVYMCVWRDSCPAHLPPSRPASFIINPDDQVAMSLCPCQGMLRSDLWTSIRHSPAHVYRSCTACLTRHLRSGFGIVHCGYMMKSYTRWVKVSVCSNQIAFWTVVNVWNAVHQHLSDNRTGWQFLYLSEMTTSCHSWAGVQRRK